MDLTGKVSIFVYGTLMRGFPNEIVISSFPHEVFPVKIKDVELYDVGNFPAMVKGKHSYEGELVVFDSSLDPKKIYANMDRLEGYNKYDPLNSLYVRKPVTVYVGDELVETEAYFWNLSTSKLSYIDPEKYSGYREYKQA